MIHCSYILLSHRSAPRLNFPSIYVMFNDLSAATPRPVDLKDDVAVFSALDLKIYGHPPHFYGHPLNFSTSAHFVLFPIKFRSTTNLNDTKVAYYTVNIQWANKLSKINCKSNGKITRANTFLICFSDLLQIFSPCPESGWTEIEISTTLHCYEIKHTNRIQKKNQIPILSGYIPHIYSTMPPVPILIWLTVYVILLQNKSNK